MRSHLLLGLLLLVGLTGCMAIPSSEPTLQEQPIHVNQTNTANTTHTFELWMAEYPLTQVQAHMANRSDYTMDMGEAAVSSTNTRDLQLTSSLSFPNQSILHGRYTLSPGETQTLTISEPYPDTVFVVVVYDADSVEGWVEISCGDGVLTRFKVRNYNQTPNGGMSCG